MGLKKTSVASAILMGSAWIPCAFKDLSKTCSDDIKTKQNLSEKNVLSANVRILWYQDPCCGKIENKYDKCITVSLICEEKSKSLSKNLMTIQVKNPALSIQLDF